MGLWTFVAILSVLLLIGAVLFLFGRSLGNAVLLWSGVVVLVVVGGFVAFDLVLIILCYSGAGCV